MSPDLVTLIGSVGFPIVACAAMGYYVKYTTDKNREQIDELNARHHEEMQTITQAVNNNTLAVTRLCDLLSGKEVQV